MWLVIESEYYRTPFFPVTLGNWASVTENGGPKQCLRFLATFGDDAPIDPDTIDSG